MARNQTAQGKLVRRFGDNIFGNPKYDQLLKKKPNGLGEPKKGRIRQTEYARQLAEKQKLKWAYGLSERQFRNLFDRAKAMPGVTGHNMLILLERRLDNVVFRLGFAQTRSQARQLVTHGHVELNGRSLNVPSAIVRASDEVRMKERKTTKEMVRRIMADTASRTVPPWLTVSRDDMLGTIAALPTRDAIPTVAEEQLIVEFYSK